jgi:murein DD-endopeptidase MepM/ murein hydrolase activator NlpD
MLQRAWRTHQSRRVGCAVALLSFLFLALFASGAHSQGASGEKGIAGRWEGTLGGALHLVLTISESASGEFSGTLNSVDQAAVLPMDAIKVAGDHFRFEVKAVGGVYEGVLNAARTQVEGTWTQTGVPPQPLSFARNDKAGASSEEKAAPAPTPKPLTAPLDVSVPFTPAAFRGDGKAHLVYELHIANMGRSDCKLTRVEVAAGDSSGKSLATFAGAELENITVLPGQTASERTKLSPGAIAVVFMWVTLDRPENVPATLRHRLSMKVGDYPEELTLETPPVEVSRGPVVVISPPLRGDNWLAGNGPSNSSGHRRALIPIDGRARISQRFAIDWVRLNPDGSTHEGDPKNNKNYRAYGEEILAAADGIVTEVKDGIPENVPGPNSRAVPITLDTIGGNHVVMRIASGLYAFFAHMQPGSIRVKVGDNVHRGQIVGLLGNSGNSTEPHLHFQLCDANSPLGSEGLPYAFASFEVQGRGWGWKSSEAKGAAEKHEVEMPLENEVVRFLSAP